MSTRPRAAPANTTASTSPTIAARTAGKKATAQATAGPVVEGRFLQMIYSPRGDFEGVLIEAEGEGNPLLQLVFERHDAESGRLFAGLSPGQHLTLEARPLPPSPKGSGPHPVQGFGRLVAVDGRKPVKPKPPARPLAAYRGKVLRLNHARHGAANGVVLDTGDFIHLKPEGMTKLKLKVGDEVQADGDAHRMADASGWVVEATKVNGKLLAPG